MGKINLKVNYIPYFIPTNTKLSIISYFYTFTEESTIQLYGIEILVGERSERDTLMSVQSRIAIYMCHSTYVNFAL